MAPFTGPYLDIKTFRERGYLHEVNRLLLHPLGLALSVEIGPGTVRLTEQETERLQAVADQPGLDDGTRSFLRDLAIRALTAEESLAGVWDQRGDPGGIEYGWDLLSEAKARHVAEEWDRRQPARVNGLGFMVQPLGGPQLHVGVARLLSAEERKVGDEPQ